MHHLLKLIALKYLSNFVCHLNAAQIYVQESVILSLASSDRRRTSLKRRTHILILLVIVSIKNLVLVLHLANISYRSFFVGESILHLETPLGLWKLIFFRPEMKG